MDMRPVTLDDKYDAVNGRVFMTGIQALVRLPLDQIRADRARGLKTGGFISGYRGSPLGGYDQQLERVSKRLDALDISFQPGLNEDLGATAVWGSQQVGLSPGARKDGVFGLWYGKAPGVDRTGDVFKHANFAGTSALGGVVAIAGDDHQCKSSTLPSQSEYAFRDFEMPVLSPSSVDEVLAFGRAGIEMSRYSGLWVGLIALADTMDSGAVVDLDQTLRDFRLPADFELPDGGLSIRNFDEPLAKEMRLRRFKLPAAKAWVRANGLDRPILKGKKPRIGIVASGQAVRDVFEALDAMGISPEQAADFGLAVFKVSMPWPLTGEDITEFCRGLEQVLVVEHKRPLIEEQLKEVLYDLPDGQRPRVLGKRDEKGAPLLSDVGSIPVAEIVRVLLDRLPKNAPRERGEAYLAQIGVSGRAAAELQADVSRKPHYCSGCPHNTSTVVPDGSRALAGIGCHYMVTFMPERKTDFTSQMGGEGVGWIGQMDFTDEPHVFANLGDGTYSHSGSLAIRQSVAAKANITYKILYNDAVAMTGGQHVESGQTVVDIVIQLKGEGVKAIVIVADDLERYRWVQGLPGGVEVYDRGRLDEVQRRLREIKGVSALVYDQVCATEKRRRIKRGLMKPDTTRAFINTAVCEGCGDCSKASNCLSVEPVETEFGAKRRINQSSCNQDLRCVDGFCPSFVTIEGGENAQKNVERPKIDASGLADPVLADLGETWNVLFTGIGGTGVTTVAAILGMAAHIDGLAASTLDMTGLAQKGGPVVSHLRFAKSPELIRSGRIPAAATDALIGGDIVVATAKDTLALVAKDRTRAIANIDVAPTAAFVRDRNARFEGGLLKRRLERGVTSLETLDAESLANTFMNDSVYSNMISAGFAWQHGLLPISLEAVRKAIELNGTQVKANIAAFDLGRVAAAAPDRIPARTPLRIGAPAPTSIDDLIKHREAHLTSYQDAAYAARYRTLVDQVRAAEATLGLGEDLTRSVATNLAKLMAYKDEYEVARLYTDGRFQKDLNATFSGDYKLKVWLSPPLFAPKNPDGTPKKIAMGRWMLWGFKALARMKGLRGTAADVFGKTAERKMERALRDAYEATISERLHSLSPATHALMVEFASLPDQVRGFGHVKEASVKEMEAKRAALLTRLDVAADAPSTAPVAAE
jgi:indolepyruvate ferredoxin oxidoreductase